MSNKSFPEDDSHLEHEKTDPGKMTRSALEQSNGENLSVILIRDVLKHMKEQNEQQRESNKDQRESNKRLATASRRMVVLIMMVVFSTSVGGFLVLELNKTRGEIREVATKQIKLQESYETLDRQMTEKLNTASKDIREKVGQLEDKVDDAPKVTSDEKGKLSIELPVAAHAAARYGSGSGKSKPMPTKAVFPLHSPTSVELK